MRGLTPNEATVDVAIVEVAIGAGVAVAVAATVEESPPDCAAAGRGATATAKPITASAPKTASVLVSMRVKPPAKGNRV